MRYFMTIGCWMLEVVFLAAIFISLGYAFPQALMMGSMFLPVLFAMKYFLPQVRMERRRAYLAGVVCLFLSFLCLEYLLLMLAHFFVGSYDADMPDVLLNPFFLILLLGVLFAVDAYAGKWLDGRFGKAPKQITFTSDRRSVTLLVEQILYVESNDAETWIHTVDGEAYRNKTPISQWEQLLEDDFLRTHRAFIVNTRFVTHADADALMLGEISVPISRKYKEYVRKMFPASV